MASFPSLLEHASSAITHGTAADIGLGVDASFMPFTLDVAPLQRFLIHLAQQVELGQKERDALRQEVQELKVERRLEALEQGLQDLADNVQRQQAAPTALDAGAAFVMPSHAHGQGHLQLGSHSSYQEHHSGDGNVEVHATLTIEVAAQKERLARLERRSEALWHVQENDEQLRSSIERLKLEVSTMREQMSELQAATKSAQNATERMDSVHHQSLDYLERLQEKVMQLEGTTNKALEDRSEIANNWESTTTQMWDQIRHVEASLSQRLAMSETSQVSALQEVDEMKELSSELMQRVDEAKRHMGALEGKLESFNTQVAAAISPLHTSISSVNTRMAELAGTKLDISQAITEEDVAKAASRAVDHADRRSDGILKSIAGVEERIEALTGSKADRLDVVLLCDLQRILDTHASGLDGHLAAMRASIMQAVDIKANREELAAVDVRLGTRLGGLEQAILKGLKAISDKVSAALSEKLALASFTEFKVQVRAVLADLEDRLRDWSPTALATKTASGTEGGGATTCLFCDSRVKSVRDLRALGFNSDDRVFSPERLPTMEQWQPGAVNASGLGAHINAKAAGSRKYRESTSAAARSATATTESLPAVPGAHEHAPLGALTVDAMSLVQLSNDSSPGRGGSMAGRQPGGNLKVDVETISGAIGQGRIPNTRNKQAPKATKTSKLPTIETSVVSLVTGWTPAESEASSPMVVSCSMNNISNTPRT